MLRRLGFAVAMAVCCSAAQAHVVLETKKAAVGAETLLSFRMGHGCGNSPTRKIRIRIPDGVVGVEPQDVSGWAVETQQGSYGREYHFAGNGFKEGVKELTWAGTLPPHQPASFTVKMKIADELQGTRKIAFPVVQECEEGIERWIGDEDDDHPAPTLTITSDH